MAKQTIVAIAIPAGISASGTLRANVYLTPRLDEAPHLSDFPDWLHWPQLIADHGLTIAITSGGGTANVAVDADALRPDVWHVVFSPTTLVAEYPVSDFSRRVLVSYPSGDAYAFTKFAYQAGAASSPALFSRVLSSLLAPLAFRDGDVSTLDTVLSQTRVALWREQQGIGDNEPQDVESSVVPPALRRVAADLPDGTATLLEPPSQTATRSMGERFALYHHLPPADGRPPLPSTPDDFGKIIDFHRALTALNSYPALLRAVGLVLEIELPADICPPSPGGGAEYATLAVSAVDPGWTWSITPSFGFPPVAYLRTPTDFAPAPATTPADLAANNFEDGDVIDGFLTLTPSAFQLIGVELDGAMLKTLVLADSTAFAGISDVEAVLPSLRSGGVSLMASDRAQQLLQTIRDNEAFDNALTSGGAYPRPLNARDLVRGYRLDIFSSATSTWRSLHRRDGTYAFGDGGSIVLTSDDEEGFTQLAVVQPAEDPTRPEDTIATAAGAPQPGTDLYVHERVARWAGWSLSAPRPGTPLNRSPDPALAATPDPTAGQAATPFPMTTTFVAHHGTLPSLRFGDRYRIRARVVDLTGHSAGLDTSVTEPFVTPGGESALPYLRFEPVPVPTVVLRTLPGPGGGHVQLVIRSRNTDPDLDSVATSDSDERHVAPPKAATQLVEHHGMLDAANGHLQGDAATYDLVVARDAGAFSVVDDVPLDPSAQLAIPYFPDPLARGAALVDLPATADDTTGTVEGGVLNYSTLAGVETRSGSVTHIDFGANWLDRAAFRIRLVEGVAPPVWDDGQRVLTASVPKAWSTIVALSSYVEPDNLELLGVWNWMRELFDAAESAAFTNPGAGAATVGIIDARGQLTQSAIDGTHPMLTPAIQLTFVHATQQPIGRPAWARLPIVHHPDAPVVSASLANAYSPITAWRSLGSHHAVLLGALHVHGKSTAVVDLSATWIDFDDDLANSGPTQSSASAHVDRIPLSSLDGGELAADGSGERDVAVYIPSIDTLWFAAPFDALPGVPGPSDVAAPVHQFGDTKHRRVRYTAVSSSRFQEYFTEPGLDFTRTSDQLLVSVPSSARPGAPSVEYVVPTFGWQRNESTNVKTEVRFGNSLRVYLDRPWYSSGEGELLGVVLWPGSAPDDAILEATKTFVTQWGLDPIWATGALDPIPATWHLSEAVHFGTDLALAETTQVVDVAGSCGRVRRGPRPLVLRHRVRERDRIHAVRSTRTRALPAEQYRRDGALSRRAHRLRAARAGPFGLPQRRSVRPAASAPRGRWARADRPDAFARHRRTPGAARRCDRRPRLADCTARRGDRDRRHAGAFPT